MNNSNLKWSALKSLLMLAGLLTLTACKTTGTVAIDTSCAAFEPISWSSQDTPLTVAEIKKHNAAWGALCKK